MSLRRAALLGVLFCCAFGAAGCASPGSAEDPTLAPPPGTELAGVTLGMTEADVRERLGEPYGVRDYQIWKAWNPFYFGQDTSRSDWTYADRGRVIFARNRYSGRLTVLDVAYEPVSED